MDRYGARALMLISFMASVVCYSLTAVAANMATLYASRWGACLCLDTKIPTGRSKDTMLVLAGVHAYSAWAACCPVAYCATKRGRPNPRPRLSKCVCLLELMPKWTRHPNCRVPTLVQHAVLAARTIVAQQSSEAERAAAMGYVGVAYGVGFALVGGGLAWACTGSGELLHSLLAGGGGGAAASAITNHMQVTKSALMPTRTPAHFCARRAPPLVGS